MWHCLSASIDAGAAPLGRSSNVLGCIGRRLFSFGGENVPRVPVDGYVQVFDLDTRTWTQVCPRGDEPAAHAVALGDASVIIAPAGPWPCARVGAAAATCGGKLFVYGGRTEYNHDNTLADFWSFDPATSMWARIPDSDGKPGPLSYHAMSSLGDDVFVFGGCKPVGRANEVFRFNTTTGAWTELVATNAADAPSPRGGPACVAVPGGQLHVLFGYNGDCEQSDHHVFDIATRTWSRASASAAASASAEAAAAAAPCGPPARSVTDAVFLGGVGARGSLFVFGGEFTPSAQGHDGAGEYHGDSWLYDLADGTWRPAVGSSSSAPSAAAPAARGWFNTVATGANAAAIFGGFDGIERRNDVHVFEL